MSITQIRHKITRILNEIGNVPEFDGPDPHERVVHALTIAQQLSDLLFMSDGLVASDVRHVREIVKELILVLSGE